MSALSVVCRAPQSVLDGLAQVGARVCGYSGGDPAQWVKGPCDCKFGGPRPGLSEHTGCCEIRAAHRLILALEREAGEARHDVESMMADRNLSQSELDDLAELVGVEKDAYHGMLRDRVAGLGRYREALLGIAMADGEHPSGNRRFFDDARAMAREALKEATDAR